MALQQQAKCIVVHTAVQAKLMLRGDQPCFAVHVGDGKPVLTAAVLSVPRVVVKHEQDPFV